jgi:hypothetical protein
MDLENLRRGGDKGSRVKKKNNNKERKKRTKTKGREHDDSNSGTQFLCYSSSSQIMIGIWRRITFHAAS